MIEFQIQKSRVLYTRYGIIKLGQIEHKFGRYQDDIKLKLEHGLSMSYEVPKVMKKTGLFHESYEASAAMDGLFHDIGRFQQYLIVGNLKDAELEQLYGVKDHGRLGEQLLHNKALASSLFIPISYLPILRATIGNHTEIYNPLYECNFASLPPIFTEYSLEEIIKKEEWKNLLIGAKILFVVEADNFELISNIIHQCWTPIVRVEPSEWVTKEVWNQFIDNKPIMISEMKKRNCWSANSGVILRFGLLPQKAILRSTLEILLEKDYLKKLYERTVEIASNIDGEKEELKDSLVHEGYRYATLLTENIIKLSDTVITKEKREEAVQLTKKMWR